MYRTLPISAHESVVLHLSMSVKERRSRAVLSMCAYTNKYPVYACIQGRDCTVAIEHYYLTSDCLRYGSV